VGVVVVVDVSKIIIFFFFNIFLVFSITLFCWLCSVDDPDSEGKKKIF
jgi:hypothetical protein